jgi:hypothetical protein
MTDKKQKRQGPGKPPLSDVEKTVFITFRAPASLREKFNAVGGSDWARDAIEKEWQRTQGDKR